MSDRSISPGRVAAEFSIILFGVLAALVADDWRQGAEQTEAAEAATSLLIEDLRRDSAELALVVAYRPGTRPQMGRLLVNTDRAEFPVDSAESAMRSLLFGTPYNPVRSTFDLLIDQDRLRHMGDLTLQTAIVRYYDQNQDRVVIWRDAFIDAHDEYGDAYAPYMSPLAESVEQVTTTWASVTMRLTVPWDVVRRDNVFMNTVMGLQAVGEFYERFAREAMAANAELLDELESLHW